MCNFQFKSIFNDVTIFLRYHFSIYIEINLYFYFLCCKYNSHVELILLSLGVSFLRASEEE